MAYDLEKRLVIGLASSALFDLSQSHQVFLEQGEAAYRDYQLAREHEPLKPGVAFSFIRRLLALNDLSPDDPLVEVVLLSRNDPNTGLRVMNSIRHHDLDITRAVFLQGGDPSPYIQPLSISLFLSANQEDVHRAVQQGYPAGQVLNSSYEDAYDDQPIRVAFDFDGVIADDESERVYQQEGGLPAFFEHEVRLVQKPHNPGLLQAFLLKLAHIQEVEQLRQEQDASYVSRLRIAIVTARNAPAHERVINTIRSWGIEVNEAFFLGGIEKRRVLEVLQPHIFFDDQTTHLIPTAQTLPSVHIPFGVVNHPPAKVVVPEKKKGRKQAKTKPRTDA